MNFTRGQLNMKMAIHVSDPIAFFAPIDRFNERYDEPPAAGHASVLRPLPGPQGRWRIYGICLSDSILKKVYYANAARELGIHL